jgi:hypothetical protein
MDDDREPWAGAVGKWVWLRDLRDTVEREWPFIPWSELASRLRQALETNMFYAEVSDWDGKPHVQRPARDDWASKGQFDTHYRITLAGWEKVDWHDGMLAGHPVRILWAHVQREVGYTPGYGKRFRAYRAPLEAPETQGETLPSPTPSLSDQRSPKNDWDVYRKANIARAPAAGDRNTNAFKVWATEQLKASPKMGRPRMYKEFTDVFGPVDGINEKWIGKILSKLKPKEDKKGGYHSRRPTAA